MPSVDDFIINHLPTVEHLEVLLLLFRSPETFWTRDAVAQHLGMTREIAAARLDDLRDQKLIVTSTTGEAYRFAPAEKDISSCVADLANRYRDQRIAIINTIYSARLNRLRSFADAFRIGGGKKET